MTAPARAPRCRSTRAARSTLIAVAVAVAATGCSMFSSEGSGSPSSRVTTPRVGSVGSAAAAPTAAAIDVCAWLTAARAGELLGPAGKGLTIASPGAPTSAGPTSSAAPTTRASAQPTATVKPPTAGRAPTGRWSTTIAPTTRSAAPTPTVTAGPSTSPTAAAEPTCTYSGTSPDRQLVVSRSTQVDAAMANALVTLSFKGATQSVSGVGDRAEHDSPHALSGGWVEQRLMVRDGAAVTTVRFLSKVSVTAYGDRTKELLAVYRALPKPTSG